MKSLLSNNKIIRHEPKIRAIIYNARAFLSIIENYGSAEKYLSGFEELEKLKADLTRRFKYFGPAVADHFLQRIGYDVLKPDVIIRRLFYRLGITERMLENKEADEKIATEISGHIAKLMGIPVTALDRLLHWFGRRAGAEICTDKPKCDRCLVSPKCENV